MRNVIVMKKFISILLIAVAFLVMFNISVFADMQNFTIQYGSSTVPIDYYYFKFDKSGKNVTTTVTGDVNLCVRHESTNTNYRQTGNFRIPFSVLDVGDEYILKITDARLSLYNQSTASKGTAKLSIWGCDDYTVARSYTELSDVEALDAIDVDATGMSKGSEFGTFDVTEYVKKCYNRGQKYADFTLGIPKKSDTEFYDGYFMIATKSSYNPKLVITAEVVEKTSAINYDVELLWANFTEAESPAVVSGKRRMTAKVGIKNLSGIMKLDAKLIMSVYKNNSLVGVGIKDIILDTLSTQEFESDFLYDSDDDLYELYTIKTFLWDSETIIPLTKNKQENYAPLQYFTTGEIKPWLTQFYITDDSCISEGVFDNEGGQSVKEFVVFASDPDIMLMSTNTTGVYQSTDGGNTWKYTSEGGDGLAYGNASDILIDEENPGVVYTFNSGNKNAIKYDSNGTKEFNNMGIYKSIDYGATWSQCLDAYYSSTGVSGRTYLLWKNIEGTRYLYVITEGSGIFRTSDGGQNWENVYYNDIVDESITDTEQINAQKVLNNTFYDLYSDDEKMLALCSTGIKKSVDGITWTDVEHSINGTSFIPSSITVNPENLNMWIAVASTIEQQSDSSTVTKTCLYRTEDGGDSWTKYKTVDKLESAKFTSYKADGALYPRLYLTYSGTAGTFRYSDDLGYIIHRPQLYKNGVAQYSTDANIIYFSSAYWSNPYFIDCEDSSIVYYFDSYIWKSVDGGATFDTANRVSPTKFSGTVITDIVFDSQDSPLWYTSIDKGLFKSGYANPPELIYPTINPKTVFPRHDVDSTVDIHPSTGSKSSPAVIVDPNDPDHLFSITGHYGYSGDTIVIESTDGFESFDNIRAISESENLGIDYLKYHRQNSNIIYAGCMRSDDNGQNWKYIYLNSDAENSELVYIKDVSDIDSNLVVGSSGKTLYYSTDCGDTWNSNVLAVSRVIDTLRFDLFDKNKIWLTTAGILYTYDISTGVLTDISSSAVGLSLISVDEIAQNPSDANHIMVTNRDLYTAQAVSRVYETFDGGKNWHTIKGLPKLVFTRYIHFHPSENVAYISTQIGTMVYEYDVYKKYIEN